MKILKCQVTLDIEIPSIHPSLNVSKQDRCSGGFKYVLSMFHGYTMGQK